MRLLNNKALLLSLSFVIFMFSACEKKVVLKIKEQKQVYPVIFGFVTNEKGSNKVYVSVSQNYNGQQVTDTPDVNLSLSSLFETKSFSKSGRGVYLLNSVLQPYTSYSFTCNYNSTEYTYTATTMAPAFIDSLQFIKQSNNTYSINCTFTNFDVFAIVLAEVYVGEVNSQNTSQDTVWKKYNSYFPNATTKTNLLRPFSAETNQFGQATFTLLKDCELKVGQIIKVELFVIDSNTSNYLGFLDTPDNFVFDPLSIAPPQNNFAFSNNALGIIIPAMKSSFTDTVH